MGTHVAHVKPCTPISAVGNVASPQPTASSLSDFGPEQVGQMRASRPQGVPQQSAMTCNRAAA